MPGKKEWPGVENLQFPEAHACLLVTLEAGRSKLYIQAIDAYARQRELSLRFDGCEKWEMHVYMHPGLRRKIEVTPHVARSFMQIVVDRAKNYPTLLFNATTFEKDRQPPIVRMAQSQGFVRLHDQLLLFGCDLTPQFMKELKN
jgi:hypothetical protein